MALTWIREKLPVWDEGKQGIVGEAPAGVFDRRFRELAPGSIVPGEWWRVEEDGQVVGYGWLDVVWGDAEILLAVAPRAQRHGIGSFVLQKLEDEARARGLAYLYNVVRPTHPDASHVTAWLVERGFRPSEDGCLLRAALGRRE